MAVAKSKTETKSKTEVKVKKDTASTGMSFKCRLCGKQKPIAEMRVIKRYRPVLFVCHECEKTLQ